MSYQKRAPRADVGRLKWMLQIICCSAICSRKWKHNPERSQSEVSFPREKVRNGGGTQTSQR